MSDKTKTKTELLEMLAEAVRNTQPQPVGQPNPARDPNGGAAGRRALPTTPCRPRQLGEHTTGNSSTRGGLRGC